MMSAPLALVPSTSRLQHTLTVMRFTFYERGDPDILRGGEVMNMNMMSFPGFHQHKHDARQGQDRMVIQVHSSLLVIVSALGWRLNNGRFRLRLDGGSQTAGGSP